MYANFRETDQNSGFRNVVVDESGIHGLASCSRANVDLELPTERNWNLRSSIVMRKIALYPGLGRL